MLNTETGSTNTVKAHVIAFPAKTPLVGGRQIHFLFSVRQVVDVLKEVDSKSVASDQHYIHGIAEWRGRVVPVICLEECLGLQTIKKGIPLRTIVIRGVQRSDGGDIKDRYAICEVGAAVRQYQLPFACKPIMPPEKLLGVDLLKGLYVMREYLFMVVDIKSVLADFNTTDVKETARAI
jgi:chemotaxis signal transduction protein